MLTLLFFCGKIKVMKESELRRNLSVLTMSTVMALTDLTARQIRYYEEQALIAPVRNDGNRRLFSLNDIDKLLEIKDLLSENKNISDVKQILRKERRREAVNSIWQSSDPSLEEELAMQSRFFNPNSTVFNQPRL